MNARTLHRSFLGGVAAGALVLGFGVGTAGAASVQSQMFPGQVNLGSDNSATYLLKGTGNTGASAHCPTASVSCIEPGDRLRGLLSVETIEDLSGGGGTNPLGGGSPNNEWTAVFEVEVVSVTPDSAGSPRATIVFGPSTPFQAESAARGAVLPGGTQAIVLMFEDATKDYTRVFNAAHPGPDDGAPNDVGTGPFAKEEELIGTATDGSLTWALGFGEDADEFFVSSNAFIDIATAKNTAPPSSAGTTNFGLSILDNRFSLSFGQVAGGSGAGDSLIDINGSVSILGTGTSDTPFDVFDDLNFTFAPRQVPEPGTLGLLGVGLIGLGLMQRRRKRSA